MSDARRITTLIVPGLNGSGPDHWQTWLEARIEGARRVVQADWATPDLPRWAAEVGRAIEAASGRIVLVAHSFGCLASVTAASRHADRIAGALLVAPADPAKFGVAALLPHQPLGYPGVLVASRDDPWVAFGTARHWAGRWGCRFIDLGEKGHVNAESGFGPWPEGHALWARLVGHDVRPVRPFVRDRLPAGPRSITALQETQT